MTVNALILIFCLKGISAQVTDVGSWADWAAAFGSILAAVFAVGIAIFGSMEARRARLADQKFQQQRDNERESQTQIHALKVMLLSFDSALVTVGMVFEGLAHIEIENIPGALRSLASRVDTTLVRTLNSVSPTHLPSTTAIDLQMSMVVGWLGLQSRILSWADSDTLWPIFSIADPLGLIDLGRIIELTADEIIRRGGSHDPMEDERIQNHLKAAVERRDATTERSS